MIVSIVVKIFDCDWQEGNFISDGIHLDLTFILSHYFLIGVVIQILFVVGGDFKYWFIWVFILNININMIIIHSKIVDVSIILRNYFLLKRWGFTLNILIILIKFNLCLSITHLDLEEPIPSLVSIGLIDLSILTI